MRGGEDHLLKALASHILVLHVSLSCSFSLHPFYTWLQRDHLCKLCFLEICVLVIFFHARWEVANVTYV